MKHKKAINELLPLLQEMLEASKDGLSGAEKKKIRGNLLKTITKLI